MVSPDDPDRDLVEKRVDYAEAGIAEYWIADPSAETIEVLTLHDDAQSPLLPGLAADVAACFDAPTVGA